MPGNVGRWGKGKSGNPRGRVKGSKNKRTLMATALTEAALKAKGKGQRTPMEFLLEVMNDPKSTKKEAMEAAGMLLPYVHSRMPQAISATVEKPEAMVAMIQDTLRAVIATTDNAPAPKPSTRPRLAIRSDPPPSTEEKPDGLE